MRIGTMWPPGAAVVLLAALGQTMGCHQYYETPAPQHFTSATVDTVAFDSIRAYARSLKYDTMPGAADESRMRFDSTGKSRPDNIGDLARIEPELGAWRLDTAELAQGRIIARIHTDSAHLPTGYGPWDTWWWIDRKGGQWRSLLLSDSLMTRFEDDSLRFTDHAPYQWGQSIAQWRAGSQWGTCSKSACCIKE
jgi:hypothetical protein